MHPFFIIIIAILSLLFLIQKGNGLQKIDIFITGILIALAILDLYVAPYGFDRNQYKVQFEEMYELDWFKDPGWSVYVYFLRFITNTNVDLFFLINDIIFTGGFVLFGYKKFQHKLLWYYLVVTFISIGFYNGGTNILRSGLAISLIFYGLAFFTRNTISIILFLIFAYVACTIHLSTAVIVIGLAISFIYPNWKVILPYWCFILVGSYLNIFSSLDWIFYLTMGEESYRLEHYISGSEEAFDLYQKAGFRPDFILYSLVPIIIGLIYIIKYNYKNQFFLMIFNAYMIINSIWLILIRIPFADRFAIMSWVFIPVITVFPLLTSKYFPNRKSWMAIAIIFPTILNLYTLVS